MLWYRPGLIPCGGIGAEARLSPVSYQRPSFQKRDRSQTFRGKSGTPDLQDLVAFRNTAPGQGAGEAGPGWETDEAPRSGTLTGWWLLAMLIIALLGVTGALFLAGWLREEPQSKPGTEETGYRMR